MSSMKNLKFEKYMTEENNKYPDCFGVLDHVFPMGEEGLRHTPESCLPCIHKIECLKAAMGRSDGLKVREESLDRAYAAGMVGFWERWSQKKSFYRQIKKDLQPRKLFFWKRRRKA